MDRSRNRLKAGDRVIVLGYHSEYTGEFEPHATVEHVYPLTKNPGHRNSGGGVLVRLDGGGDYVACPSVLIHEPVTPAVVV